MSHDLLKNIASCLFPLRRPSKQALKPCCIILPHLQHSALLEAKAILEQTSDVGQVHTQERADGRVLGHLIAH